MEGPSRIPFRSGFIDDSGNDFELGRFVYFGTGVRYGVGVGDTYDKVFVGVGGVGVIGCYEELHGFDSCLRGISMGYVR